MALLLAFASPGELELLGITAVAGNVPLELTQRNARMLCDIAGMQQVAVYAGCAQPLVRPLETAERIHGTTGINGLDVFEPATALQAQHAVDFIVATLLAADDASIGNVAAMHSSREAPGASLPSAGRGSEARAPSTSGRHVAIPVGGVAIPAVLVFVATVVSTVAASRLVNRLEPTELLRDE